MKVVKIIVITIISLLIGSISAWILRGEYDKHFMMEGYFHVISNAKKDHNIVLQFPSGKEKSFLLKKGTSIDFKLRGTGEGSISIFIDGKIRDKVGYVTSMNSAIVLVINDTATHFSQIFPSLLE